MIYHFFKQLAFQFDPELVHRYTLDWLHRFPQLAEIFAHPSLENDNRYQIQIGDLTWPFPVGLAAGLDKDARAVPFFSKLLLGAIEVGTVTPKPQSGNPRPRLFRLPREQSLRNQMGFNGQGMEAMFRGLVQFPTAKCLGVNLGKNKATTAQLAARDYQVLYEKFAPIADYLVINISSPNTPGLRALQQKSELEKILQTLEPCRERRPCPLFVKLSPDINFGDADEIVQLANAYRLAGIIACNTSVMEGRGPGGISGGLLFTRAKALRSHLLCSLKEYPHLHLIGVGGFSSFEQIKEYWQEGGRAIQVYTALIYQGPQLLVDIKNGIDQMLEQDNAASLEAWLRNHASKKLS